MRHNFIGLLFFTFFSSIAFGTELPGLAEDTSKEEKRKSGHSQLPKVREKIILLTEDYVEINGKLFEASNLSGDQQEKIQRKILKDYFEDKKESKKSDRVAHTNKNDRDSQNNCMTTFIKEFKGNIKSKD